VEHLEGRAELDTAHPRSGTSSGSRHSRHRSWRGPGLLLHRPGEDRNHRWRRCTRVPWWSWICRRGPLSITRAARLGLAAKDATESFTETFAQADRALERLDALLPARDPTTPSDWLEQLREAANPRDCFWRAANVTREHSR
jgi:hypothetical protein